ncbi:transcriptional regulator [Maledivibacter halophilus]|uniref:Uncharacterized protein n=1 Tax=Maledivibacter halophilus TaxID=36842 RepID=A0A1T5MN42_9FIRM|nr:hypothetical protein [Maledivibacter halophilus]SKC89299.1 hypothetical protein SAMN02194393_05004 [Maledivibacter halophilus]
MKKICYILTIIILINLAPYNAFANDDEICDEVFEKGQFIELYTSICDSAINILNSSIDDSKKEEKLQNLFDNYKLDTREMESPKSFINIDSYNKEKKWVNMITRGLINTIEVKIEDSYFQYKDPINRIDKIDALLKFYKLDKEISKYELMKLDDKFSSIDIYGDISDIIENYNTKKQLALSLSNVVERIENEKKYSHIKTILEEYLMAHQLGDSIDSSELVKLVEKTKDNDKRVKLLFDEIIIKKNEKKFQEKIENIAEEIIESINYNKYYDCAERISGILKDNDIAHGWNLDDAVANVAQYTDMGYKTKQEAIQSEVFSQIKFSYSKEEIDTILDEIVSILEAESEAKMSYKEISTEHSDEIYEEFLDLVYDYRISDIKQYIIPEDIAYAYYNYEDLGYETAFESTVEHLRKILKKSELNDNILKVIKESKYNLPVIIEGVTVVLDDEDEYKEYLNTAEINKIIDSKPKNIDAAILELILDSIIESRKEYIIYFTYEMDELNNRGNKDKEIKIANILNDKRLYSLVDEDKIMDLYIGHNDKDIPLKQELYNELFKKLISSKSNIENTIKESIIKIIDEMDSINNQDLEYIIDKTLMLSGLDTYVIQNDIKNAYCFPLKYGYSDRKSGIVKIIEKGMNEKISSEIHDIFNKNLNKRDTEKEIRIVLKRNYLDSNMSFTEIKEKYKK